MNNLVLPRRGLILGLTGLFAAPALIKVENLMKTVSFDPRMTWSNLEEINRLIKIIWKMYPQIISYDITGPKSVRIKEWASKKGGSFKPPDVELVLEKIREDS